MLTSLIYNLKDQIMNSPDIEEINAIAKTISDNKELVPVDLDVRIKEMVSEMESAFLEIQQPRTDYALRHFVVNQHDTKEQQYAQCVLELQIKYDNIRRALLGKKKVEIEIRNLEKSATEVDLIDAEIKKIDLEEQNRAMLGAWREFKSLYKIWQEFPKKYTREELDAGQSNYWRKRLTRQANQDLQATGRVQVGNMESLTQIGMTTVPELDHVRDVEKNYLTVGDRKVLIVVPTREKAEKLACLENLVTPSGVQVKYYNVYGRSVHDAYNDAAMTAIKDGADFMLTIEDDTFPPENAFSLLLDMFEEYGPKSIVGAWYPKKQKPREGTPIVLKNGKRSALKDDGKIHEVYTIPMGCTLFPISVFLNSVYPYFATTEHLTQDSFFSQKAREAGYKLIVNTSIKCGHLDINTGKIYV